MATTFATATDWKPVVIIPEKVRSASLVVGGHEVADGYEWVGSQETIIMERIIQGLTSFESVVGNTALGNTITVTNGSTTLSLSASKTYECMEDQLLPDPQDSGIWREVRVIQWRGGWKQQEVETGET